MDYTEPTKSAINYDPERSIPSVTSSTTYGINKNSVEIPTAKKKLPLVRKIAFGFGHVFNDLCVGLWISYLIIFYHYVIGLSYVYAGLLYLVGQVADAVATPLIGYFCDKTYVKCYGRRKLWHLMGTVVVATLYIIYWYKCINCEDASPKIKVLYYAIPIAVIQFGWTSVQISHLALIPELTEDKDERMELNAIRYGFTIVANVAIYVSVYLLLQFDSKAHSDMHSITPADLWIFSGTAMGIVGVGLIFSILFHLGTKEPVTTREDVKAIESSGLKIPWYRWFINPQFYLVAVIYMCSRMAIYLSQVYMPLFFLNTLHLSRQCIAIGPLVVFISGFFMTLFLKFLNKVIGRYVSCFIGCSLMVGGVVWLWGTDPPNSLLQEIVLYGACVLIGASGATLQVTSFAMVSDIISTTTGSGAFVYGVMSFTDKLSHGLSVQAVQYLNPCNQDTTNSSVAVCEEEAAYYRTVLVSVPSGSMVVTVAALVLLSCLIYSRKTCCRPIPTLTINDERTPLLTSKKK